MSETPSNDSHLPSSPAENQGPSSELSPQTVLYSGFLKKRGVNKLWKKRWFVLRPSGLAYYHNEKEYELSHLIEISKIHSVAPVEYKDWTNVFGVVTKERTFYLEAPSSEESQSWMKAMSQLLKKNAPKSHPGLKVKINAEKDELKNGSKASTIESLLTIASTPSNKLILKLSETPISALSLSEAPSSPVIPSTLLKTPGSANRVHFSEEVENGYESDGSKASSKVEGPSSSDDEESTQSPQIVEDNRVIHHGYLLKRRSKYSTWKKRWFVLRNSTLTCYKDDKEYVASKVIYFSKVLDILELDALTKTHAFCFKIVARKLNWTFCASSQSEMEEWIAAMRSVHEKFVQKRE